MTVCRVPFALPAIARLSVAVPLLALLAGCAGLGPSGQNNAVQHWTLFHEQPQITDADALEPVVLRLIEIDAPTALDTTAMVYREQANQLSFYRDNRWAAPPAEMIQHSLKAGFERQDWVRAVLLGNARLGSDIVVACDLDRLEHQVVSETQGQAHLTLSCAWVKTESRSVVERTVYAESTPFSPNDASHFVAASQQMLADMSDAIVQQTRAVATEMQTDK